MNERLKDLFEAAIDLSPGERAAFVESACGGDRPMRDQLVGLLSAHDAAGDFLEHPAELVEAAACDDGEFADDLEPGERLGAYTLQQCLGRGGFASV